MVEDAVKAAPHVYKVILENDRVRVLDTRMKPGDKTDVKGGEISYHVGGVKLYHSSRLDPRCCCS